MKLTRFQRVTDTTVDDVTDLTWSEFVERLRTHDRRPGKDGPGWSPATFLPGTTRADANVIELSTLVFDVDKAADGKTALDRIGALAALRRVKDLGLDAVVTTSHSHAPPDKWSLRLAIRLPAPVPAAEWRPLYRAAAAMLGFPVEMKCENESRFWYWPSCPDDATPFVQVYQGGALDVDALLASAAPVPAARPHVAGDELSRPPRALIEHVLEHLKREGPAVQFQGGDKHTFHCMAMVRHGYGFTEAETYAIAQPWNLSCDPPWEPDELREKISNAEAYAQGEFGAYRRSWEIAQRFAEKFSDDPRALPAAGSEVVLPAAQIKPAGPSSWLLSEVISRHRDPIRTYPTGFLDLNLLIGGGLKSRTLTVVLGPPGAGKSGFAVSLSLEYAQDGRATLYVSTELESDEMAMRHAAPTLGVPWTALEGPDGMMKRGDEVRAVLEGKRIKCIGAEMLLGLNTDEVLELIARAVADMKTEFALEHAPLVIVDYMQDLARGGKEENLRGRISDIATKLRGLSQSCDCAVLAISSVSRSWYGPQKAETMRSSEYADIYLSAAKESGDVDYAAATVLFLDVDPEGGDSRPARIAVAKARRGRTGFAGARFDGPTGRWTPDAACVDIMSPAARAERKAASNDEMYEERVMKALAAAPSEYSMSTESLRHLSGIGNGSQISAAVERLIGSGKVKRTTDKKLAIAPVK